MRRERAQVDLLLLFCVVLVADVCWRLQLSACAVGVCSGRASFVCCPRVLCPSLVCLGGTAVFAADCPFAAVLVE